MARAVGSSSKGFCVGVVEDVAKDADETTPMIPSTPDCNAAEFGNVRISDSRIRPPSPNYLLVPFAIHCIAMGAVAVPKINVILALICVQYEGREIVSQKLGNDQVCDSVSAHSRMAQFMMCAHIISGVGSAISSPRIGKLSDRYGRKPLLAYSALGLLFGDVISIATAWFPHRIPVYLILLEFLIGGLTGSFAATMAIAQAYAADCTEGQERVSVFSKLHACMYSGQAIGPAVGGMILHLAGDGDLLTVFYAAGVCHAGFILFVLLGLRESSPKNSRLHVKSARSTRPGSSSNWRRRIRKFLKHCNVLRPLKILRPKRGLSSSTARRNVPLLASIDGMAFGIQLGLASILILYSESQLGWKTTEASLFVSLTNATRVLILTAIMPLLSQLATGPPSEDCTHPGSAESSVGSARFSIATIRVAIVLEALSFLGFAAANNAIMYTMAGVLAAAGAPASPTAQSLMTTYVDADKIGELLGAVSLLHALARCFIPAVMQFVYSITIAHHPEVVFWILSVFFAGAFVLSLQLRQ